MALFQVLAVESPHIKCLCLAVSSSVSCHCALSVCQHGPTERYNCVRRRRTVTVGH